ncbi:FMN-dependent NADH-azoreductase [Exiguobacterium sp. SH31]|uniref:FMN-dependent NADH-azoreductase n=1 Tax=unclassified Exiguobacterium TaxID=2644629 RepID=UPI0008B87DA0|nr:MULTISPECIES: NAD(P)H-dependent oxidoreductase [unclassified Exiguobacterium]OGX78850.1 FMN-dependent NADH-azoreductase [Exiguobacterium sp. SH31]TCI50683.1 FMN-dependent NADH-azoreductase [Exiguobacterium sp. SH1S21]TCI67627.1 FMN-dependent NADH-azoreductase [Exiguobacterium sp. SH0S7]
MKKVLYVSANPKPTELSYSKQVAEAFMTKLQKENASLEVEAIELYDVDVQEIDGDVLSAWGKFASGEALTDVEASKVATMNGMLEKFMEADLYVFATPMWNFFFPARMKMFLDSVLSAGKTFRYTEQGPVGLLENKQAIHIQGTGGIYTGTDLNFADAYLRQALAFVGVNEVTTLAVEGMNQFPDKIEDIVADATAKAEALAKEVAGTVTV